MYTRQVLHNAQLKTQAITLQGASATLRTSVEQVCCRVLISRGEVQQSAAIHSRAQISRARKQGPGAAAAQFLRLPPVAPTTALQELTRLNGLTTCYAIYHQWI